MVLRAVLLSITVVTMTGVLVIGALLFKSRKDKIIKAASPSLLYLMLAGALILYTEIVIGFFSGGDVTCMLLPWIRHVGFSITYGSLLVKTWRISVIMQMLGKAHQPRDCQLLRSVAVLTVVSCVYMLVWTLADPIKAVTLRHDPDSSTHLQANQTEQYGGIDTKPTIITQSKADAQFITQICVHVWWDYIISAAEFGFLIWGGTLCYQARKAPDIYNETRPISYAIWNEGLWTIFYAYSASLLKLQPNSDMTYILCFLRTQCTVTVTLLLLFVPKFLTVFSTLRELRGNVSEVYGAKRVHRLSLLLSKGGAIKTVYCVPCGPLTFSEGAEEEAEGGGDSASEAGDNNKENHYTKAEVDALIEMVTRLKNEKNLYKTQVKRMYHLLKEYKHKIPISGLPVYLVAENPDQEGLPQSSKQGAVGGTPGDGSNMWPGSVTSSVYSSCRTLPVLTPDPMDDRLPNCHMGNITNQSYHNFLMTHSRKASTVETYISTPDNLSLNGDDLDMADEDLLAYDKRMNDVTGGSSHHLVTSPVCEYTGSTSPMVASSICEYNIENIDEDTHVEDPALTDNGTIPNGLGDRTDLKLDIPQSCRSAPHSKNLTAESPDFPILIQRQDKHMAESPQEIQDFISTICGKVVNHEKPPNLKGKSLPEKDNESKSHEMDTLKNGKTNIITNAVKLSAKAFDTRNKGGKKGSDKMSFVMYI